MSLFTPYVKIYFNETATFGTAFVLNDATQGVLDNVTYTLVDTVPVDVTSYVSGTLSCTRGRSRETDQYQSGSLSFTLRNEDRRFDPSNTASSTGSALKPRLQVEAGFVEWGPFFTGFIDDINVRYEQPNISEVDITCVDAFAILANQQLASVSIPAGTPGNAINAILTAAKFNGGRYISTGYNAIQASTQTNTDALTLMQTIARSDNGALFVDYGGIVTFFDRYYPANFIVYWGQSNLITFTDNQSDVTAEATKVPFTTISQRSAATLLYNQVTGTRTGGAAQTANDTSSQASYQVRSLALGQLENASDTTVSDLCNYLVSKYAQPEVRFDAITVSMNSLQDDPNSAMKQMYVTQLEINTPVVVTRTPPGTGTPSTVTKSHVIDGIAWNLDVSNQTYDVTFTLASMDTRSFLILDDPQMGVLETAGNKLGY